MIAVNADCASIDVDCALLDVMCIAPREMTVRNPHGEEARRRHVYAACVDLAALPSPDDASHRRENHEASVPIPGLVLRDACWRKLLGMRG
jgi:hypothetical protein